MSGIFTPSTLDSLKQQASQSLTDTFNIMFNFELSEAAGGDQQNNSALRAFVELRDGPTKAYLNVTIPRHVIDDLTKTLGAGEGAQDPNMGQDITGEIANIVGHAVRSHFISHSGVTLTVGLPQPGNSKSTTDNGVVSLHFLTSAKDPIDLDFVYLKQA